MDYNVVATGSSGNAVILDNKILIDCGVSFKHLSSYVKNLGIVLLTHIHQDHFKKSTIERLAKERPMLRFACCEWLTEPLKQCGVKNIDILEIGKLYNYKQFEISPFKLYHDVENCGYRIFINGEKALYATDTATLDGVSAKDYSLYLVEANYQADEIHQRIAEKISEQKYVYEYRVFKTHLSKENCDRWLMENKNENSAIVYLHQHKERK